MPTVATLTPTLWACGFSWFASHPRAGASCSRLKTNCSCSVTSKGTQTEAGMLGLRRLPAPDRPQVSLLSQVYSYLVSGAHMFLKSAWRCTRPSEQLPGCIRVKALYAEQTRGRMEGGKAGVTQCGERAARQHPRIRPPGLPVPGRGLGVPTLSLATVWGVWLCCECGNGPQS